MCNEREAPRWRFTLGPLPRRPDGSIDQAALDQMAEAMARALLGDDIIEPGGAGEDREGSEERAAAGGIPVPARMVAWGPCSDH